MDSNNPHLHAIRHSLAHLFAAALLEIHPKAKITIGPPVDDGFYYDFQTDEPITEAELPKLEKHMKKLLPTWDKFEKQEVTPEEARKTWEGNPYKLEIIEELVKKGEPITFYKSGKFTDLCRGGHVESMKEVDPGSFKLHKVAGAYWRGDSKNAMLTRVYGLAFESKEKLEEHLKLLEEAEKRDHKVLGPKLDLFMFHPTSPGMPYWLPKGVILYNELVNFWRKEHRKRGYQEIVSPLLNKKELYITSGHYEHYWENMFVANMGEHEEYGVKAMNCPNAHIVFGSKLRSYKELPLRLGDTDHLHRYELAGTLNGLLRVREFRQDDAHIYVTEDMIESEYMEVFQIVEKFYSIFGMQYRFRLGTRPQDFMGDIETWNKAEATLKKILAQSGKDYFIEEGDGAFYGPKVDILMKDALGRDWQMGTVQLDFQQPRRFELEYIAEDGSRKTPIAIHRVIYGSLERFIGILIEHYAGAFPLWLSPVQVAVLPISENQNAYAKQVMEQLEKALPDLRMELDGRNESIGKKIREATQGKVPYQLIIGQKEAEANMVAVRSRDGQDLGQMGVNDLVIKLTNEIANKL